MHQRQGLVACATTGCGLAAHLPSCCQSLLHTHFRRRPRVPYSHTTVSRHWARLPECWSRKPRIGEATLSVGSYLMVARLGGSSVTSTANRPARMLPSSPPTRAIIRLFRGWKVVKRVQPLDVVRGGGCASSLRPRVYGCEACDVEITNASKRAQMTKVTL
jgi:hypothetical protein